MPNKNGKVDLLIFNPYFELILERNESGKYLLPSIKNNELDLEISEGSIFHHTFFGTNYTFKILVATDNNTIAATWIKGIDQETLPTTHSMTLSEIYESADSIHPELKKLFPAIKENTYKIPYLFHKDHQYIYPFRAVKNRNSRVYHIDEESTRLYESKLCQTIKELKRTKERTSGDSAWVDFGKIRYVIPSHFGFCLGVQNAIERAYEALTLNPGRRVFMLSDLIHNPFVNEDLNRRGLRYLQTDKGVPVKDEQTGKLIWDSITKEDIIVIPAFGATDEDKARLIEKGIPFTQYDATCMLVEKVWKAAKRYGQTGHTIIIHGKAEHEETRTTFSNATKNAPAVIIRNLKEALQLISVIEEQNPVLKKQLFTPFRDKCSSGFDPVKDLDKIAVVNQTTLLRNETMEIITYFEETYKKLYGADAVVNHISKQQDTLCYATQVNQDALTHALNRGIDFAIIVGGKNSSNTYQLFRICEDKLGDKVAYIQSEENILSKEKIEHYLFISEPGNEKQGIHITRDFLRDREEPYNILITGGASCPDGLIQQVISKINHFYPEESLRSIDTVLREVETDEDLAMLK